MTKLLVIGKRGGILHWFEDVLDAADPTTQGFSLTHNNLHARLMGHLFGKNSRRARGVVHSGLRNIIQSASPDMILIVDLFYLEPETNALIAQSGAITAQWIGDRFEDRLKNNTAIQHFFFTDTSLIQRAAQLGIKGRYLPLATSATGSEITPWNLRKNDLLFIGTPSQNRLALLEKIDYPTTVYGSGWPALSRPHIKINNYRISIEKTRKLYRQYKYVLNIINSNNITTGLPARCFDVTARGACLITDKVADLSLNFNAENEVLVYDSAEHLNVILGKLQATPELGQSIAEAGRRRTINNHTFVNRLDELMLKCR